MTCQICAKANCIGECEPKIKPTVPDAIHHTDLGETLEYIQGWNDCRQAMLAEQPVNQLDDINVVDMPAQYSDIISDGGMDPRNKFDKPAQQDYERGFIDGMQKQMQSSVDRAVNAMAEQPAQRTWVGLTDDERLEVAEIDGADEWFWKVCKAIEAKLKELNT